MVRRDLSRRDDAARECVLERRDRLARREVHEMDRSPLAPGESEIALDHDALRR